ncbi:hypothetical protein QBC37DRAFT_376325 [Rhypophila decipiens]|uniref:Uncharacterized protein n=1 Tax=Rhypophila decipiens TaxID=261697 RepID=A0AAN6Y2V3_9PEZI|nr:hypothetical protein QBC37DRAFT_376325 [Rhypophila decipiens]
MSDERREELRKKSRAIHDFKCWSGLKWWADVFKAVPTTGDFDNKMRQSSAFAFFAGRDMQQFEWLRRREPPVRQETTFECMQSDLHANIMEFAIGSSASDSTIDFQDQKVVMAEKHELIDNNIVSCIRMINFQVGESFYSVPQGKDGVRRLVRCHVEFSQIDAEFDMAKWETFSQNIAPDQKKAVEDFIFKETLDMDPPAVSAATGFVSAANGLFRFRLMPNQLQV